MHSDVDRHGAVSFGFNDPATPTPPASPSTASAFATQGRQIEGQQLLLPPDTRSSGSVAMAEEARVLDAIHKMVVQTQRDNVHSHPTDCPREPDTYL